MHPWMLRKRIQNALFLVRWPYIVIVEVDSHFMRLADQASITLPCTDIYRMNGLRIEDWRVYADISIFYAN